MFLCYAFFSFSENINAAIFTEGCGRTFSFFFFVDISMLLLFERNAQYHTTLTLLYFEEYFPVLMVLVYDIMCWDVHGKYIFSLFFRKEMEHFHSCRQIPKFQSIFFRTKRKWENKTYFINYNKSPQKIVSRGTSNFISCIFYAADHRYVLWALFTTFIQFIPINLDFIFYSMKSLMVWKYNMKYCTLLQLSIVIVQQSANAIFGRDN